MSQRKSKTMPMQIFWEVVAVYYGIVRVVNLDSIIETQRIICVVKSWQVINRAKNNYCIILNL